MSKTSTKQLYPIQVYLTHEAYTHICESGKELNVPLGIIGAFLIQTNHIIGCQDGGKIMDFYARRQREKERRRKKTLGKTLASKNILPIEHVDASNTLLQSISDALKSIQQENGVLRDELAKLKTELGCN